MKNKVIGILVFILTIILIISSTEIIIQLEGYNENLINLTAILKN